VPSDFDERLSALNRCSPPPSANASSQNLVNATAIEIDHFETPPLMIKAFANGRQVTELIENEARSRVIVALLREGDGQPVSHLVDRHAAGDEPGSIVALHGIGFDQAFIRSELTDDRFQDVGVRDNSFEVTVLVVDECHMDR
jgi:hypothetical protein